MLYICKIKRTLLLIFLFYFMGYPNIVNGGETMQKTDSEHFKKMEELAIWFIETGIGQYYERKGKNNYKLRPGDEEWFVNYPDAIWISDYIEKQGYFDGIAEIEKNRKIARIIFGFDRYRLMNMTECFLRTDFKGEIYEYWVVKEWKTGFEYSQAKFIIARTTALNGQRTILHTSDQFIEKYEIDKEFSVLFPIDDLRTLYGLQAWHFPDNFKNSNLNEFQVFMPEKGKFETIPWP